MALEAKDLIQPEGELEPDLFGATEPGGDTQSRVAKYLVASESLVSDISDAGAKEQAQAAYVYWRAFSAKARRMQAVASRKKAGDVEVQYIVQQAKFFESEAAKYEKRFNDILADVADKSVPAKPTSRAVVNQVEW